MMFVLLSSNVILMPVVSSRLWKDQNYGTTQTSLSAQSKAIAAWLIYSQEVR
jgi:hypothetical protein